MRALDLGNGRLAYWDVGSGPSIVFIHGVATSGELWAQDLEPLASDHRVVVYDRRGYGGSSESPRDWRVHAADAAALVDALGSKPATLVGYSAGAVIALNLTLRRPDIAAALVLVDPVVNLRRCITAAFVRTVAVAKLLRRLGHERQGAERWLRYVASYSTGGTAFDRASPARREILLRNAPGIFADADSAGADVAEARIASLRIPATIVEAALSAPFIRRSCARLRKLLPEARVVTIARAGHHITVDARDELIAAVREAAVTRTEGPPSGRPRELPGTETHAIS